MRRKVATVCLADVRASCLIIQDMMFQALLNCIFSFYFLFPTYVGEFLRQKSAPDMDR